MMTISVRRSGFSLVEISIVLVVVATMLAGVLPAITESQKTNASTETIDRMEAIEQAILTYRVGQERIPCPSSLTLSVNVGNFGKEGATPGTCTGGTPAATFGPSGQVVAGGVPVKTLGLPDEYAFDGWGRRFVYYVDKQLTLDTSYATTSAGSITIMDGAATPTVRTATAAYALLSPGPNGHGGYTRSGSRFSFGTTNTRELENCDCTSAAANGTFNATLHQYMATSNTDPKETFDDIVRYASRPSLDLLAGAGAKVSQGLYATWSQSLASGAEVAITGMTAVNNDMPNSTFAAGTFTVGAGDDGWYTLSAGGYAPNAGDELYVVVKVNGTVRAHDSSKTDTGATTTVASTAFKLTAGSTVTVGVRQLTGATKVFTGFFSVARVSGSAGSGSGGGGSSFWADAGSNNINNTNTGNVGVGTTTPAQLLDVNGTAIVGPVSGSVGGKLTLRRAVDGGAAGVIGFEDTGSRLAIINASGGSNVGIFSGTPGGTSEGIQFGDNSKAVKMTMLANGNVGIGTAAPSNKLSVSGGLLVDAGNTNSGGSLDVTNSTNALIFGATGSGEGIASKRTAGGNQYGLDFYTGFTNKMAILSNGNVGIGTTAPAHRLDVNGNIRMQDSLYGNLRTNYFLALQGDRNMVLYDNGGAIWFTGTNVSDVRFKEQITPLEPVLTKLMKLQTIRFRYKKGVDEVQAPQIGVIAQEIEKEFPEFVYRTKDTSVKGGRMLVDYNKLTTILLKGLQELKVDNDELRAELTKVKADGSVGEKVVGAGSKRLDGQLVFNGLMGLGLIGLYLRTSKRPS